jgi:ACS family hexuronate transporter-like MFS transporter
VASPAQRKNHVPESDALRSRASATIADMSAPRPLRHLRWYIAVLLCCSTALNYLDRQTLSVLASTIQRELHLTDVDYSRITFAFLLSYAVMYAVGGRLIDTLGTRRGLLGFATAWSAVSMLHGIARSALQLSAFRLLLGVTEAANVPAGVKAVSEWFPVRERALAIGIFNAGTAIGAALAAPVVSVIALQAGWRAAFVVTGALGLVWVAAWAAFYRLPAHHPRLDPAERALIEAGDPKTTPARVSLGRLLRMRETWGCIVARMMTDPISYFLAFWIPKYLEKERGFALAQIGKYAWIPFVAQALGNVAAGAIPRVLVTRGWGLDRARKRTMLTVSCVMPLLCLLVTRVEHPAAAVAALAALMFGHAAWGNVILPAEVFPKHLVGTVSGLGGMMGGLVGAAAQLGIGKVVQATSFGPVFAVCAFVYLVAFTLVARLVPDLGRIRLGG